MFQNKDSVNLLLQTQRLSGQSLSLVTLEMKDYTINNGVMLKKLLFREIIQIFIG